MYLSRHDIEMIAQRVITAYKKLPALCGQRINKVQPELLICDLLGLSMDYHVLSMKGDILGLTACSATTVPIFDGPNSSEYYYLDGRTILIDKRLLSDQANIGRRHFTQVHEACHQIYKMLFPEEYMTNIALKQIHYCTDKRHIQDWGEWQTDALTSAVLMPYDMIRSNMADFGLGDKIHRLNRVFAPNEYNRFCEMANYMGVSEQALSIRLQQLELLEVNHLKNPYELVDIFPGEEEQNA